MADNDERLNLYERLRHEQMQAETLPDTRRWWEKQRYIIPIAVAILAVPIWYVAGLMVDNVNPQEPTARDRVAGASKTERGVEPGAGIEAAQDAQLAPEPSGDAQIAVPDAALAVPTGSGAGGADGGVSDDDGVLSARRAQATGAQATGAQDAKAAVCARVLALRDDLTSQGVDALTAYSEMLDIQRQAAGTSLDDEVDAAVEAMDGFAYGTHDSAAVAAASGALLAAC